MMVKFGFGEKWRGWMAECLSLAHVSILVNGSPTEEFRMERDLRQGDPLSPFLFLLVAQGLHCMIQKAVVEGLFEGINVGSRNLHISHLQFASDTVIMGKARMDHIRTVKGILRWFELISGLKVNLKKSSPYAFNPGDNWLSRAANFLKCKMGEIPFLYLEMPVGENSRRRMWLPVIENFYKKLASWKAQSLSFGGRLVLLKSVLSSLPLYYLSLFKIPTCVLKIIEKIQRDFLWGMSGEGERKICWVRWDWVCLAKEKGGLGVRDLRKCNLALLGKWWARFVDGSEGLWKKVLLGKHYGAGGEVGVGEIGRRRVSKIWEDIVSLGKEGSEMMGIVGNSFTWEVGDGNRVKFWKDVWLEGRNLGMDFPRLKNVATNVDIKVGEMREWCEGVWR
ncbi:hypothetical protein SLEP1_g44514 [Rubroshorea leprosula]|uniref:Reverse transcriptase domain-containing protein n=1 Tax=Rubroshorea leprosula TaxID=152421 RepID=A0AAV5LGH1_9ROSI|nr:hypothetical protein SLEP1_g44514 [Rubroshorea leprosula]